MRQKSLENITGNIITAFKQIDPDTILHAFEIQKERQTNVKLRKNWQWTADFPMYQIEKGEAILYFASRQNNLIFQNIDEAVKQIKEKEFYKPTKEGIKQVVDSVDTGETLRIKLSDLKLTRYDSVYSYFEISTSSKTENPKKNYELLNDSQKALSQKVYGKEDDFEKSMKLLKNKGIKAIKLYVLNPKYVKKHAKDYAIARVTWLSSFKGDSIFNAGSNLLEYNMISFRGVRKKTEDEVTPISEAYKVILNNTEKITKEMYEGLLGLVTNYFAKSK